MKKACLCNFIWPILGFIPLTQWLFLKLHWPTAALQTAYNVGCTIARPFHAVPCRENCTQYLFNRQNNGIISENDLKCVHNLVNENTFT